MGYDYKQLNELLGAKDKKTMHRSSSREGKKMNTWLKRHEDHIGVHFVESEIMRYYEDGTIVLDSDGWQTHTTKQRMNDYLPWEWGISQNKGLWSLYRHERVPALNPTYEGDYDVKSTCYPFNDGITITPEGTVAGHDAKGAEERERLLKQVNKYVKGYVDALARGDVPAPGLGDCFYCQMRVVDEGKVASDNGHEIQYGQGKLVDGQLVSEPISASKVGQTLGEATGSDHLLSHFEEPYYVPSLLYRAIELHGLHDCLSQMALWWIQEKWYGESNGSNHPLFARKDPYIEKQVRNCLKKYLKRQLGLPS